MARLRYRSPLVSVSDIAAHLLGVTDVDIRIADNFDQSSSWWAQKQGHATISERLFEHGGLPFDPSRLVRRLVLRSKFHGPTVDKRKGYKCSTKDGMDRRMPIVLRVTVVRPPCTQPGLDDCCLFRAISTFGVPFFQEYTSRGRITARAEVPVARVGLRSVYQQGHAYRTRNQIASAGEYAALDRTRGGNSAHHSSSTQESPPPSILERGRRP
ncbi:hypothetical protein PG984_016502 [Apiospora sp. TS-2023a]